MPKRGIGDASVAKPEAFAAAEGIGVRVLDMATIKPAVMKYLNTNTEEVMGSLLASLKIGGSVALTVVGNLILIPVVTFYLLRDWDTLVKATHDLLPRSVEANLGSSA